MSKAALSATVQAHILKRVRSQADKFLSGTKLKIFDKKGKEIFNPEVGFSLEQIRKETNPNQEASISRGGLKQLANTFNLLNDTSVLATDAVALLGRDSVFDELSKFLLQKVNKQEKAVGIRSMSGAFSYTGVRENETDTTAKLATAKNREESFRDVVLVNNISHGKFNEYFVEFLRTQTTATTELVDFIKENIDTGHLSGVFNIRLQRIFGLKVQQTSRSNYRSMVVTFSDANEDLNDIFQKILTLISDADYLSSNIKLNLELFSNTTKIIYDKNGPKVSVETQLSLTNQEIGRKLAASSRYLNQLLDAAKTTAVRADAITAGKEMQKFLTSLKPLADEVNTLAQTLKNSDIQIPANVQKAVDDILRDNITVQNLLSTEGSDPAITSINKTIGSILEGKKIPNKQVSTSKDKAVSVLKARGKSKQTVRLPTIKKKQVQVRASQAAIAKVSVINLPMLMMQINSNLHDQIKRNMGTGNRRDVLNYRTGRFAESAKVERLSESRQGMITAFYSYMKNPYATFSRGGRQERPFSRDPKLLISKSIRELAGSMVANRMRAVNV